MKRIGLRCLKVAKSAGQKLLSGELRGFIPGKVVEEKKIIEQETYREETLEPLIQEALLGKKAVFFVDAAPERPPSVFGFFVVFC